MNMNWCAMLVNFHQHSRRKNVISCHIWAKHWLLLSKGKAEREKWHFLLERKSSIILSIRANITKMISY